MKKAQSSIFIIIGIVLVIALLAILGMYYRNAMAPIVSDETINLDLYSQKIKTYVEECMFQITVPAIYMQAAQGGYFTNAPGGGKLGNVEVAYWYKEGKDMSPELEDLESNLASFLKTQFSSCTDFKELEYANGLKIIKPSEYSVTAKIMINNKDVSVDFYYPVELEFRGNKHTIEKFTTEAKIGIGSDFNLAKKVLENAINAKNEYSLDNDCDEFSRISPLTNVYYANGIVLLNDYNTFYDKKFGQTVQFRYLIDGPKVYGRCTG